MQLPNDYAERVYAGVLGKTIGVYLGRPFEGMPYDMIQSRLGDIEYYVHEKMGVPLLVTDDDIAGTFTFVRSFSDNGCRPDLSAREIGESWLNYLIEHQTILWWGGLGNSTEHTAYLRLKSGIEAPRSGSAELNSKVVSEQIGAQIFIDGWAMLSPGNPDQAARFAQQAASVSHDGEAVYGAIVLAVMEAMAFVEQDTNVLLDTALTYIPADSVIRRLIDDVRNWCAIETDWRATRERLAASYGYDKYGGNCHMVPNHGLIIMSLLHGRDDFAETMKIINTCGWDTDCNAGNVGCLMGIKLGLAGIDAGLEKDIDWRGPVADRIYVTAADPSWGVSDCVRESQQIINAARQLTDMPAWQPKDGAQFHFEFPGSLQGFTVTSGEGDIDNVTGASDTGNHALRLSARGTARFGSPVFTPSKEFADWTEKSGNPYRMVASPRVYPGQTLLAKLNADKATDACLYVAYYDPDDEVQVIRSPVVTVKGSEELRFQLPAEAYPAFEVGIETSGTVHLDSLGWIGEPEYSSSRHKPLKHTMTMWRRAWVSNVDDFVKAPWVSGFRLVQNRGRGLLIQGTRDWRDIAVTADVSSDLCSATGIAVRVQGLRRYYALLLHNSAEARIVKVMGEETILASEPFAWQFSEKYDLKLSVRGNVLTASINGSDIMTATDNDLDCGSMALVIEEGCSATGVISVAPA